MTPIKKTKAKAAPNITVAEYISQQVDLCGKSQKQIAEESGFGKPNIITMLKKGDTKLPLEKVGKFAKAIEVDPIHLLRLCLREYLPDTFVEIERMFGQPVLTDNELGIIEVIRSAKVVNPKIRTEEEKARVIIAINALKGENAVND